MADPLLSRIRNGDASVTPDLVPELSVFSMWLCQGKPNRHELANELVQQTWVRHLARRDDFYLTEDGTGDRGETDDETVRRVFAAYLKLIAKSVFLNDQDRTRRAGRRSVISIDECDVASQDVSPDEEEEQAKLFGCVSQAVEALPPQLREVITLRYNEGLKPNQIAQLLGVSQGVVSGRFDRALDRLKQLLGVNT